MAEPLALNGDGGVKQWLRIDDSDTSQDGALNRLIKAARQRCESVAGLALITQTWQLQLDRFPGLVVVAPDFPGWEYLRLGSDGDPRVIRLPRPPLQAVSSIQYTDTTQTVQTLPSSGYIVDNKTQLARVFPSYGNYWPVTLPQAGSAVITYTAGFGDAAANVPAEIQDRLLAYVAHCYEHREDQDDDYLDRLFVSFAVKGYF